MAPAARMMSSASPKRRAASARPSAARRRAAVAFALANGLAVHQQLERFGDAPAVLSRNHPLRRGARRRRRVCHRERVPGCLKHRHVIVRVADRREVVHSKAHGLRKPGERMPLGRRRIGHLIRSARLTPDFRACCVRTESSSRGAKRRGDPGAAGRTTFPWIASLRSQ